MDYEEVINFAMEHYFPGTEEERKILSIAEAMKEKLSKLVKGEVFIGGSLAKGTFLRDITDVDIFIRYDYERYNGLDLSNILGEEIASLNPERLHGSRDYFRVIFKEVLFEIIPILKIDKISKAKNITDISPFHVQWVTKFPELRDEIKLAKIFAKANGFYGAESYIKGFSGYALEILVIHYKGFLNLLKKASRWRKDKKTIIDTLKAHKNVMFE